MATEVKPVYDNDLDRILKGVSRSFYLTLRFLPQKIRPQISVAYLIARATDTLADTSAFPVDKRIEYLTVLRDRIYGRNAGQFETLANELKKANRYNCSEAEAKLLQNIKRIVAVMESFDNYDIESIRSVIGYITTGQELDLKRFSSADEPEKIIALETDIELDEYTFYVAGCVGEFWTKICNRHIFTNDSIDCDILLHYGINYGKGLQLINILRDIPADLKNRRCYIPIEMLKKENLSPEDLLNPENEDRFKPLHHYYIQRAYSLLNSGSEYIKMIPRKYPKLRIATALPLIIGIKTLDKLACGEILNPESKIKISRFSVWKIVALSILSYPIEPMFRRLITLKM